MYRIAYLLLLSLAASFSQNVFPATTYSCPNQFTSHDAGADTIVNTNLTTKTAIVTMNLFTGTDTADWSYTADMSTPYDCDVVGTVVDQGSRVLLSCNCIAAKAANGISPIQTATTLIVSAGSQCSYNGNLQFTCQ